MKKLLLFVLTAVSSLGSVNAKIKYITTNVNLRTAPTVYSNVLTVIPRGTTIEIDDCDCTWILVEYDGCIGYVSARYISSTSPDNVSTKSIQHNTNRDSSYLPVRHSSNTVATPTSPKRYYTNTYGNTVQSPTHYTSRPAGATALCRDGTYSFSQSRRGTCSHHGGVARWF